ncbi:type VI secretion system protein TssA [Granulicella arctica]|uniref:type VI secretion system protein TssA n=1 Tax=Granulicella arctica TaxID=940613 RepID=UPI0021DFDF05|nr:type VI secretion system protein TssA [Granulicella arctica]
MPLREDLLEPIAGDNPSGANLYYDKVFDQIKEARTEDQEIGSAGAWERTLKKADHILVIKLAGETLAKRSKDLRLAGWLVESHLKRESISLLAPCFELLWKLQENFWPTFYPEIDEDGDLGLRVSSVESVINRVDFLVRNAAITTGGLSMLQYKESRRIGFETDANTNEKKAARQDAINQGLVVGEDFDSSFVATPKSFYTSTENALQEALTILDDLGRFHEEKYGDDYPNMGKLLTSIEEVKQVVSVLLNEKRKIEPDVVVVEAPPPVEPEIAAAPAPVQTPATAGASLSQAAAIPEVAITPAIATVPVKVFSSVPTNSNEAYEAIITCAEFLRTENGQSPAPYLVCSGLRFGETRREGAKPALDFAIAPTTETRQTLRRLANESKWDELMKLSLKTLAEPCARAWLDLQRYIWRAANEMKAPAIATAVVTTVRGLLSDVPEVRTWMLDDDTPVANPETQQWIDAEILPPPPSPVIVDAVVVEPVVTFAPVTSTSNGTEPKPPEIYDTATELLKRGKTGEAITLLVRDAELQPTGRKRFQRRVQVAQLCMVAKQDPIAYPVLMEISQEIERRGLETWESGEMLAHPLSLLLQCLDQRKSTSEDKEALFERLCRLDPQAALSMRR